MTGHVEDVHFDLSVANLNSDNNKQFVYLNDEQTNMKQYRDHNLLGDSIVDTNSGQILGNEPLLTVALDDAALQRETTLNQTPFRNSAI